jgi:hypothetical protein
MTSIPRTFVPRDFLTARAVVTICSTFIGGPLGEGKRVEVPGRGMGSMSAGALAAARAACLNGLDFARLLPEADRLLG